MQVLHGMIDYGNHSAAACIVGRQPVERHIDSPRIWEWAASRRKADSSGMVLGDYL